MFFEPKRLCGRGGRMCQRFGRSSERAEKVARRRRGGVQSVEHGLLARLDLDAACADGRERVDPPLHERLAVDIGRRAA